MSERRRLWPVALALGSLLKLTMIAVVAVFLFVPVEEQRISGPDVRFTLIVRATRAEHFKPRAPGDGGSRETTLEVYDEVTKKSCGPAPVRANEVGELQWSLDSRPRTATLIGVAVWNLDACTVTVGGW